MPNEYGITTKEAVEALTAARERGYRTYKEKPNFKLVAKVEIDTPN